MTEPTVRPYLHVFDHRKYELFSNKKWQSILIVLQCWCICFYIRSVEFQIWGLRGGKAIYRSQWGDEIGV